ncbi:MAG: hypothetical protein JST89_09445 [Cyanobacteria bacterium SZAS-4]|nr:hypothetical protein [Cyanobacteria bacterium SZAS-4]
MDKAEVYIAMLFNAAILAYHAGLQALRQSTPSRLKLRISVVLMLLCCTYVDFVKETGQLLVLSILACPLTMRLFDAAMSKSADEKKALRQWSYSLGASAVVALLIFKTYVALSETSLATYGAMSYDLESLMNHLQLYCSFIPEIFLALLFCNIGFFLSILRRREFEAEDAQSAALAGTLTLLATAGAAALMFWKFVIVYAWFPISCLVLPPTAFYMGRLLKSLPNKIAAPSMIVTALFAVLLLVPTRFIQAQLQFYLDDSAKELTSTLAARHASFKHNASLGVPLLDPSSAELSEELQSLTLSHLAPNYIEPTLQDSKDVLQFFNFLNYEFPDQTKIPKQTLPFTAALDQHLSYVPAPITERGPGVNLFSYWSKTSKDDEKKWSVTTYGSKASEAKHWATRKLAEGDIFIIPFGDVPTSVASYRGTSLFCSEWKSKIAFLPQVKLRELFRVQRKISQPIGKRFTAGWVVLEVLSAPRLSWFIDYSGNLYDEAEIFAASDLAEKILNLNTQFSRKMTVSQESTHGQLLVASKVTPENFVDLKVILPSALANAPVQTTLRLATPAPSPQSTTYINVRDASVVDAGK